MISMASQRGRRELALRLLVSLIGLGVVAWAVAHPADSYAPSASVLLFVVGGFPFVAYVVILRSFLWSLGTGLALLGVTLWTDIAYALVPESSRDGVESLWIWFGFALKVILTVVGRVLDRAMAAQSDMARQA
jgi:hypothetical protein